MNTANKYVSSAKLLLAAAAAFLGAQLVGPFLVAFIVMLFGVKTDRIVSLLDSNNALRFVLILAIEFLTVWGVNFLLRRYRLKWADIGLSRWPVAQDALKGLKVYGIYFLIFIAVYAAELASGLIDTTQAQQLGFDHSHGPQLIFVFFSLVLLPPIAEEILFRGFVFMGLRRHLNFIQSALITSVLFGIAHLEFGSGQPLNWAAAIDTFTLSCVLTYAAEKYKNLWPGMLVHMLKNLLAFVLLFVVK